MEKQIFKVGDRVFDIRYGWGEVVKVYYEDCVRTKVVFESRKHEYSIYYKNGKCWKYDENPMLSFTEYTFDGLSQERPINYEDYIGKWGKFFDSYDGEIVLSKLKIIDENPEFPFISFQKINYANFEPLTDKQIQILNLE